VSKNSANALISVYNKEGIAEFAKGLSDLGWNIYASGGTAKIISEAGIQVIDVSELVGGTAILGHRVVTLSREISAGLLADKTSKQDLAELESLNIPLIDLVCVDMYPLEEAINKPDSTPTEVMLQTDIGGPTMLRSAAKGRRIVLSHADQRSEVLNWLQNNKPNEEEFILGLAARAEYEVARYVATSANYLNNTNVSSSIHLKSVPTKYGENPQQQPAGFYSDNRVDIDPLGLDQFVHVQGTERSFINMTDIDRLLETVTHVAAGFEKNFKKVPFIAVGVKHGNACGAGYSESAKEAIENMLDGDTRAIFGGVIMLNGEINKEIAETLMFHSMPKEQKRLLDGVVGASVTDEALEILSRNKLRVIVNPALGKLTADSLDSSRRTRPVRGGVLEQPNYDFILDFKADYMDYHGNISIQSKMDLILAWGIGCTSNSNTISIVKSGQLIGNGVGQQDRVGAGQLALTRTTNVMPELIKIGKTIELKVTLDADKISGSVAYSDSFFPFPDGPELLAEAGIKTILATNGSIGDNSVIETLTSAGVSLAMLPDKTGRGFYMH
jgi:phosphoribosylaminoimidazolecarboxamide formyltransferase/IMP cyclohydrolase